MNKLMKFFIARIVFLAITLAIVADEFYDIMFAGNIACFILWAMIIGLFIIVIGYYSDVECNMDSYNKGLKKSKLYKFISKLENILLILLLIGIGWTATGIFYAIAYSLFLVTKADWADKSNAKKLDESNEDPIHDNKGVDGNE